MVSWSSVFAIVQERTIPEGEEDGCVDIKIMLEGKMKN